MDADAHIDYCDGYGDERQRPHPLGIYSYYAAHKLRLGRKLAHWRHAPSLADCHADSFDFEIRLKHCNRQWNGHADTHAKCQQLTTQSGRRTLHCG